MDFQKESGMIPFIFQKDYSFCIIENGYDMGKMED